MKQTLLIIDAQQELIDGNKMESYVYNKNIVLNNINVTIEKALASDVMIVFLRDTDVASGQEAGFQIHQDIKQLFLKKATNIFHGTPLSNHLKDPQIEHVVIMGKTEYCIYTAVRTATVNGFDVTFFKDIRLQIPLFCPLNKS